MRKFVIINKDVPRVACQSQEKLLKYSSTEQLVAVDADHIITYNVGVQVLANWLKQLLRMIYNKMVWVHGLRSSLDWQSHEQR